MGAFEMVAVGDTESKVYVAGDGSLGGGGVLVLHPWWGLNDDVVAFADGLAGEGFTVVAPDMLAGQVATTIEAAERQASGADEEVIDRIVRRATDRLAELVRPTAKLAALGFSFGAHWAVWIPAERDRVAATVLYYGTTGGPVLTSSTAPILGHFADDDDFESDAWVKEFEDTLRSAGRDVVIHRYPATGHWFAEPSRGAYRADASALAFDRTVRFLREHIDSDPPAG